MSNYLVILNWNGWKDTIECLESVFRLDVADLRVVVCDNGSTDGSLTKIREWARGKVFAEPASRELSPLSLPPIQKPISFIELTRAQAEEAVGGFQAGLVLINNAQNLGFAGGTNVGLRYALQDVTAEYFWILNNDTVVERNALSALLNVMRQNHSVGICGSLNLSYYNSREVQAEGGKKYNKWTARVPTTRLLMREELTSRPAAIDFVNGASMLTKRSFLERVGLMEESYFLYFEELDWAARAKGKFQLAYSRDSVVYHKEGASIGSNRNRMKRSILSERFLSRSRVLFTKRFFPWALPSVVLTVMMAACYRACRGDLARAGVMLKALVEGLKASRRGMMSGLEEDSRVAK